MKKVLLIGEPMALFAARESKPLGEVENFSRMVSGAEVNVAIGLERLGIETTYVTRLGDDVFGHAIYKKLEEERIDTSFITFDKEHTTGIQIKGQTEQGDPEVAYYRKNSAASHLSTKEIEAIDFSTIRHVHATGIFPALSETCREALALLLKKAREHDISISFDPNLRPMLWPNEKTMLTVLNELAGCCDMVLPGLSEGEILTGKATVAEVGTFYLEQGSSSVIIKNGPGGAFVVTHNDCVEVPGFPVDKVVDTVGAGDGFAVGVVSGFLDGLSLEEATARGNAIGAMQVMTKGDNEGLPNREQLAAFMEKSRR